MGHKVFATCGACGFEKVMALGAGWSTHETYAGWPVWCEDCGKLSVSNFKANPIECGGCGSTNITKAEDPRNTKEDLPPSLNWSVRMRKNADELVLLQKDRERKIQQLRSRSFLQKLISFIHGQDEDGLIPPIDEYYYLELKLHGGDYRCPECQSFRLTFSRFMSFD